MFYSCKRFKAFNTFETSKTFQNVRTFWTFKTIKTFGTFKGSKSFNCFRFTYNEIDVNRHRGTKMFYICKRFKVFNTFETLKTFKNDRTFWTFKTIKTIKTFGTFKGSKSFNCFRFTYNDIDVNRHRATKPLTKIMAEHTTTCQSQVQNYNGLQFEKFRTFRTGMVYDLWNIEWQSIQQHRCEPPSRN